MRRTVRFVYYALSVALLGLFLVGYAARYVHPRYAWWAELVAIGLPYLSFGVALSALVALALRAWRLVALHVLVLLLVVARFGLPNPFEGEERRSGDLRLMTFNVPRWGGAAPQEKADSLRALVDRVAPDLLLLQEASVVFDEQGLNEEHTREYVRALLGPPLGYRVAGVREASGRGRTPQPVLTWRVPLSDLTQETMRVDQNSEDVTYVMRTVFEWEGRRSVLYNVHLRSFGGDKPWRAEDPHLFDLGFWKPYLRQYRDAYRARAREVKRIRAMLDDETLPVIVAGDLNSTPHSWAHRQLAEGMQDAFYQTGEGWGSTYHARLPFARIDFILASEEWQIVEARVPEVDLSDHRPMVATLRWREGGRSAGGGRPPRAGGANTAQD